MTMHPLDGRGLTGAPLTRPAATRDLDPSRVIVPWRGAAAIAAVALVTLSVLATAPGSVETWLAWLAIGYVAGSLAGSTVWTRAVPLAVAAGGALAWSGHAPGTERVYWWLGVVVAAVLVSGAFAIGAGMSSGRGPITLAREAWAGAGRRSRRALVAIVAALVVALTAYTVYAGAYGSQVFTEAVNTEPACTTPALAYGWTYEAINYDVATDAALAKVPRTDGQAGWDCTASPAGGLVRASDGVALAGWYIPAASVVGPLGPTVIVVPGWKDSKSDILKYAPAFHDDYNVVIMDVRNVGQSERRPTTLGLDERLDVRAMIDWLTATKGATSIALVGDSQGAATSLAEAVDDPRVDALILDSMHATFVVAMGNAMEVDFGQPAVPGSWAIALGVSLRVGEDVTAIDPVTTIGRIGDRPVLLTHGTADQVDPPAQSVERNLRAAREAGVPVELLYCPGATHGQTIDTCPDAWARRATSFLEGALPR